MSEHEFKRLKMRFREAEKYYETNYLSDAPERQERADKALERILDRMNELWGAMTEEERQRNKFI